MSNKILVVDDEDIIRESLSYTLRNENYEVDEAANGKEAYSKLKESSYDLVITDIEMPEMDGYALTAEIRRLEKSTGKSTPILAITASDFDLTEERATVLGFDGYMLKPLDPDILEKKLANLVCD